MLSNWQTRRECWFFFCFFFYCHVYFCMTVGEVMLLLLYYCNFFFLAWWIMMFDLSLSRLRSRGSGATVAVLLRWEPPREGDLPVRNYRITWMPRHTHTHAHKHAHALPAHLQTSHNNKHTRPTRLHREEQGVKESSNVVTQGVRKIYTLLIILNEDFSYWCCFLSSSPNIFQRCNVSRLCKLQGVGDFH